MYRIVATQDFIYLLKELPIRHLHLLMKSFVSIEKCEDELNCGDTSFIEDLLEQIKNQELE